MRIFLETATPKLECAAIYERGLIVHFKNLANSVELSYSSKSGNRCLDILHLAIAKTFKLKYFLTFDEGQKTLAQTLKFKIE